MRTMDTRKTLVYERAVQRPRNRLARASWWFFALCCVLWVPLWCVWMRGLSLHPHAVGWVWLWYKALLAAGPLFTVAGAIVERAPRRILALIKAAIVAALPWLILFSWVFLWVVPLSLGAREHDATAGCFSNLRNIGAAFLAYADAHDGRLPDAHTWCDAIRREPGLNGKPLLADNPTALQCADETAAQPAYTMNGFLSGLTIDRIDAPDKTVLAFDGKGGWNSAGGPDQVEYRHSYAIDSLRTCPGRSPGDDKAEVVFVDGHVKSYRPSQMKDLIWEPQLKHPSQFRWAPRRGISGALPVTAGG